MIRKPLSGKLLNLLIKKGGSLWESRAARIYSKRVRFLPCSYCSFGCWFWMPRDTEERSGSVANRSSVDVHEDVFQFRPHAERGTLWNWLLSVQPRLLLKVMVPSVRSRLLYTWGLRDAGGGLGCSSQERVLGHIRPHQIWRAETRGWDKGKSVSLSLHFQVPKGQQKSDT